MMKKEYLTCDELAELLKIDRQVVQKWAREEKVPCYKVGVGKRITYRFDREEILEFFRSRRVEDIK